MKVIFEGAGWDKAENNGVGNCRIRGVFTTKKGKHVYLEMSGYKRHGHTPKSLSHLDFICHVSHCFYMDDLESNRSREIDYIEREWRVEYTKGNIVKLLNHLNVECTEIEVLNTDYCVFDDERYLAYEKLKEEKRGIK